MESDATTSKASNFELSLSLCLSCVAARVSRRSYLTCICICICIRALASGRRAIVFAVSSAKAFDDVDDSAAASRHSSAASVASSHGDDVAIALPVRSRKTSNKSSRLHSWWMVGRDDKHGDHDDDNDDDDGGGDDFDDDEDDIDGMSFRAMSANGLSSSSSRRGGVRRKLRAAWRKLPYYIPVTMWLPQYQWRTMLLRDVVAGVAVASLLVPQCLAYALLAGMPPIYGLYTAFWPAFIYAMMGQSRHLSIGPDALVSILFGLAVPLAPDNPILLAQVVSLFGGIFLFVMGLLRLGFLDVVLSRPLLAGFINAVVIEIVMEQMPSLLGLSAPLEVHGWHKLAFAFENIGDTNKLTVIVGVFTIAALLLGRVVKAYAKRRWPNVVLFPDLLIIVALNIGFSYGFDLQASGLKTLGHVGSGFVAPSLPDIAALDVDVAELVRTILVIGMIGFVESIVAAKVSANKNGYSVSANRELVAYGLCNVFSSFFGVWPTFGSLTRTSIAELAGAATQVYSVVTALVVLGTIYFLGPVFGFMPKVCGSAIIVVAALNLVEVHDVVFLWQLRAWSDLALFAFTFGITVALGVELGVMCSFVISLFLVLKRVSMPHANELGRLKAADGTTHYKSLKDYGSARPVPGVAIVRLADPLFFGNSSALKSLLSRMERYGALHAHPSTKSDAEQPLGFVLHCAHVPSVDPTALFALRECVDDYRARGIKFVFVKLRDELKEQFLLGGIIRATEISVFPDTASAVEAVQGQSASLYSNHQRRFLPADDDDEPAAKLAAAKETDALLKK
jgi:high affinity sulfate transporter 1